MTTCRSVNQSYRRMRRMSCLSLLVSLVSPLSIQSKKFHTPPLKKSVKNDRVMIATRNLSRSMPSVAVIIKWPTIVIGWFLWWFVPFTVTTVKITDIPIIRNVSHDYGILELLNGLDVLPTAFLTELLCVTVVIFNRVLVAFQLVSQRSIAGRAGQLMVRMCRESCTAYLCHPLCYGVTMGGRWIVLPQKDNDANK